MAARLPWLILGLVATGCGVAGVVLPLVPTTPFLLLAAYAFARSSPRLHAWLITHPQFGPMIDNWHRHGAIGRRAKRIALLLMLLTLGGSLLLGLPGLVIAIHAAVLGCVAAFIVTRPDGPSGSGGAR